MFRIQFLLSVVSICSAVAAARRPTDLLLLGDRLGTQKEPTAPQVVACLGSDSSASCTFNVAPVEPNIPDFAPSNLSTSANQIPGYWQKHHKNELPLEFELGSSNHPNLVSADPHQHGLIATVLAAYNNHIPLILSPDDFWLPIALSVGQFLGDDEAMAEKYRKSFVSHKGKKTLTVDALKYGIEPRNQLSNKAGWASVIKEMTEQIKNETATDIADIMTSPFSTSGAVEQTVMRATLMESMKNYFQYRVRLFLCGIPQITLEGSVEDYQSLIDRVDGLLQIFPNFRWYLSRVRKHLVTISASRQGKADQDWWRRMVLHKQEGSGGQVFFSGWLADFFAFTSNTQRKENRYRNAQFNSFDKPAVTLTDFVLDDCFYTFMRYDMKLAAGFVGVAVDGNKALRPAIGWITFYHKERPVTDCGLR